MGGTVASTVHVVGQTLRVAGGQDKHRRHIRVPVVSSGVAARRIGMHQCVGVHVPHARRWKKIGEPGNGYYLRMQHEDWLLGVKPNCKPFRERPNSIIEAPRGAHSEKPSIHQMIEAACDGPYCELFARRLVANWTVCGDQVNTSNGAIQLRQPTVRSE